MYQEFYNFSAEPFRLSPDHGFAYAHKGYTKARAYMAYAFMRAEGFVMITGRPGTGKTTLIGTLLDELAHTSVSVANLVCTQLQADDLLKLVAYDFGIPVAVVEKGELLQRLTQQLKSWHRDGRRALLIVDEAQDLSISAMEELRLLTNIQVDSRPLLQIFLLGQPELRELVLSPRLEQVHQRIIAASHLRPLESDETEAYIRHRLEAVHWRGNPAISKSVYPLIYQFSEGVPRRINLICSRLLLHCAVEQRQQVAVADVREVVRELQDENLASGNSFAESDFQAADVFDEVPPQGNDRVSKTRAASQGNIAATLEADPSGSEAESPLRQATEAGDAALREDRIRQIDNSASLASEPVPQLRVVAGARQSASMQAEAGPKKDAAGPRRFPTEDSTTSYQGRVAAPAAPVKQGRLKRGGGRAAQTASTAAEAVSSTGSANRGGEKKAVAFRVAKAELEDSRDGNPDPAARNGHSRAAWPLLGILLGTSLLMAWMMLDLDVGMVVDLIPRSLADLLGRS